MPSLRSALPRVPVRLLTAVVGVVALIATTALTFGAAPASADSIAAQIRAAHQKLSSLQQQAEAATERYNAARIRLQDDQQKASSAQRELDDARRTLLSLQKSVNAFAAAAYKGQALTTSFGVTADSPEAFLDKISTLQAVTNSQSQALARLAAAQRAQEQAQSVADAALARQKASTDQMQQDRQQVLDASQQQQQILKDLQAKQQQLIQAARERAQRIAAEKAAAALRAQQRAAAQAAQQLAAQPATPAPVKPAPAVPGSGGASVAVQWAYKELGKPYVWGAAGPDSFDCSGLTMYVWGKAGVQLDHYTGSQWNEGQHVSQSQLQPGDLVFFGSDLHHVGIYVGNGNMIEAPYTGANVRVSPYLRPDYAGAVRPGT